VTGWARFDRTRRYRYRLRRDWQPAPRRVTFIMLNPSTADARVLDPTLRRCIGFAKAWGFGGIDVVNLFGWRATSPRALRSIADPVGRGNDAAIRVALRDASLAVAGWGGDLLARGRAVVVQRMAEDRGMPLACLGLTTSGQPRHPLYVPGSTPLQPLVTALVRFRRSTA
jgi:hypothetical protein